MPDHEHEPMSYTTELMAELEAIGLIRRTGHFRRSPITGKLQPVYEVTELGKRMGPTLLGYNEMGGVGAAPGIGTNCEAA